MNILLIGSGGREHALALKMADSKKLNRLFIAPGNPATAMCGTNVNIGINDFEALGKFAHNNQINMIVVGPEDPAVNGLYDYFKQHDHLKHIGVICPSQQGAKLEGSKDFAKDFMKRHNIPTARYATFETTQGARQFMQQFKPPYVLKADGLAAGKGVLIIDSLDEAEKMLHEMLGGKFGKAGNKVVIEEFLNGIEVSVFVLTDGKSYKVLPEAKDYKRIGNNDTGLNTGGMGAVSPVKFYDSEFAEKVRIQVIEPTLQGLQKDKIEYYGFIFIGLMNCNGNPYVIEYNVRMGDPETEVVMPRLNADLLDLLDGTVSGDLDNRNCEINPQTAVTVVAVSGGYPEDYEKGFEIYGIEAVTDSVVYQAGTAINNGKIVTSGGRVLAVTSLANDIQTAANKSYQSLQKIKYNKMYFRTDIGKDLINYK